MKGLRIVRPVSTSYLNHGGFVIVKGYRFFHKALSDYVGLSVSVDWLGDGVVECVDIYVSGVYICEAIRPHLFKNRNGK